MTMVFAGLGQLVQTQFGANEVASMLTIGKAIGSVITRQSDSSIFMPLAAEYGIHVTRIPPWFHGVQFDRIGTILGNRQRKVPIQNTMANVGIDSLEGIATFLVLILRYVEPPSDIVEDIEDLLRGDYEIINGGSLELSNAPIVDGEIQKKSLPFSLRGVLRSFVNSVIDADALSPQRKECMSLLGRLTCLIGRTKHLQTSLKYVKLEHQKLLTYLLSIQAAGGEGGMECFNTLSAGAAMIALAAAANGANVLVECIQETRVTQLKPGGLSTHDRESPRLVRLWLTQPPTTIMHDISVDALNSWNTLEEDSSLLSLPVYGGMSEICTHVSKQLGCDHHSQEESLALWQQAVRLGQEAQWKTQRGVDNDLHIAFSDDFLKSDVPASLGRMADKYYRVPRGDNRHRLARKAASVLHQVLNYADYGSYGHVRFKSSLDLVIIALSVGCLQSLITNSDSRMSAYAWTLDCERTLGLAERWVDTGLTRYQILLQAARVWGGITPQHLEISRSNARVSSEFEVIGIICPRIIFISNVLLDPKEIARIGISRGLISWYEGSSPILPREQDTGFIIAGQAPYTRPVMTIDVEKFVPEDEDEGEEDFEPLLFSAEPCTTNKGSLAMVLCVWHLGDLMMVLNPATVLTNLLACRTIGPTYPGRQFVLNGFIWHVIHMSTRLLQLLECGFTLRNGVGIIDVGCNFDWQVVAAGVVASSQVMVISDPCDLAIAQDSNSKFDDGSVIIITGETKVSLRRSYVETRLSEGNAHSVGNSARVGSVSGSALQGRSVAQG
jgi:hypothetical protein